MTANNKPRVVLDTNVLISALVFGGKPRRIIDLFVNDYIELVFSEEILTELRRKIYEKFPDFTDELKILQELLYEDAEKVELGSVAVQVSRDSDDNKIIETALIGNCDFIISGDNDLLDIGAYESVQIVKPAKFLDKAL